MDATGELVDTVDRGSVGLSIGESFAPSDSCSRIRQSPCSAREVVNSLRIVFWFSFAFAEEVCLKVSRCK